MIEDDDQIEDIPAGPSGLTAGLRDELAAAERDLAAADVPAILAALANGDTGPFTRAYRAVAYRFAKRQANRIKNPKQAALKFEGRLSLYLLAVHTCADRLANSEDLPSNLIRYIEDECRRENKDEYLYQELAQATPTSDDVAKMKREGLDPHNTTGPGHKHWRNGDDGEDFSITQFEHETCELPEDEDDGVGLESLAQSDLEKQVLERLQLGASKRRIAEELEISRHKIDSIIDDTARRALAMGIAIGKRLSA